MIDRRWERLHRNGWRSVALQSHADWFTGFAEPAGGGTPTAALQQHDLDACQEWADLQVPPHNCTCATWREVHLPHALGARFTGQ